MKSFVAVLFAVLCGPSLAELIGPYNITETDQTEHGNLRRRMCAPSASVTKGAYGVGEQVQVILNICQSSSPEWFGIWPAGVSPGAAPALNWQFTCGGQSCASPQNVGGFLFGMDGMTVSAGSSTWPLPDGSYVIYYNSVFGSVATGTFSIGSGGSSVVPQAPAAPVISNQQNIFQPLGRPIRVACVGDSLTFGRIKVGPGDDYPTQLAQLLGFEFQLYNFGVNRATAIRGLSDSYDRTGQFQGSLNIKPDIYLLMLGTNDAKFFRSLGRFGSDLEWMVQQAKNAAPSDSPKGTRVILALPPWVKGNNLGISNGSVVNNVQPQIRNVAGSQQVQLVDMYQPTVFQNSFFTSDNLHLNRQGLGTLASVWYSAIQCNQNGVCEVGETCSSCPSDCFVNC